MEYADSFASDADVPQKVVDKIHKNVLNPDLEKEVEDAFNLFDRDGDGHLTVFECQAAFRALRLNASREAVKAMFAEANKTDNDTLTLYDFKTLVIQVIHKRYNAGEAAKIFALLEDGTGKITAESIRNIVDELGMSLDDKHIQLMIAEAANGKNYVTYELFRKVLKIAWRGGINDDIDDEE
ncbi:EF-hand domain family protein [Babesia bovis T2Bo]|uniref:EF-hand domain family protein n=1 Tax=Babesia bovis T2Bo TaxID=484906 RepID=UPI001C35EF40|nr:EF-hand domain family protein [Babesia bovis T2Bo]EDO08315.2 EF-hand domain family protein [Babesia bovis T2Bo]